MLPMSNLQYSISLKKDNQKRQLSRNFVPGKYSVLCGRGSKCTKSSGNQNLKRLVLNSLKAYSEATNKLEKTSIVSAIIGSVKQQAPDGAFIKYEDGAWWEVEESFAREKIGCLFRDCLHTQYRSSTKAKLARKKAVTRETIFGSDDSLGQTMMVNKSMFTTFEGIQNIIGTASNSQQPLVLQQNEALQYVAMDYRTGISTEDGMKMHIPGVSQEISCFQDARKMRPQRQDFLQDCMPTHNNIIASQTGLNGMMFGNTSQHNSLLREACNIVDERPGYFSHSQSMIDSSGDFPDDLSDIFEA
jgi:hypothetical protein